jgi:hypothetical protein
MGIRGARGSGRVSQPLGQRARAAGCEWQLGQNDTSRFPPASTADEPCRELPGRPFTVRPFGFRVVREILADSPNEKVALADIDDVRRDGADLFVDYLTKRSSWDCEALAVEMPQVWSLVVNTRLEGDTAKNAVKHVFLSPQDPSGRSVGVTFTRDAAGIWAAAAPCAVRIPAQ